MRGLRFETFLAGTAIAVILVGSSAPVFAQATSEVPQATSAAPDTTSSIDTATSTPAPAAAAPEAAKDSVKATPDAAQPVTAAPTEAAAPAPAKDAETAKAPAKDAPVEAAAPAKDDSTATATPAPSAQPAPATAAAPAPAQPDKIATPAAPTLDQQVADSLKATLAKAKHDKGIESFYAARDFAPLWVVNGALSARAKGAAGYLAKVDADGLDPADYPLPAIKAGSDPAALADAELKFTTSVVTFARQASHGRVHYSRISADIGYPPAPFDVAETLTQIAQATDIAGTLDGFNPPQPGYKALKAKYAEIRAANGDTGEQRIARGKTLSVGKTVMSDPRVPQLRERLGLAAVADDTSYDKTLAEAVKKFQKQHGLKASGDLTDATVEAINGPRHDRDADIILANMERWRWMPRDLGKAYSMLNIPDYSLKVVENGKQVWTTRVVVGKPDKATPILTETMKYITINPTWNVPPSIIYNEYLPALQQDPTVLDRMGLKLTQNRDGSVHISQPPSERNALGRIRFNFPNKFLVYQHDTPDKNLFAYDKRAFSHGCMRVQDPAKYAEVLLNIALPNEGYTAERIKKMYGSNEHDIKFPTPIPVHITYQTAFVDEAGKLQIRADVYGRDTRVLAALKGDDRRFAEVPVEHAQQGYSRPSVRLPERYAATPPSDGGGFFERLFGGGAPAPAAAPPPRPRRTVAR